MPEFKNKEEYQKWKTERAKQSIETANMPEEIKQSKMPKTKSPYAENKLSNKKIFLIIGILLIVLVSGYSLWSYMTHGHLSGNVYLTMKSGDIKKAAGIGVYLLKIDDSSSLREKLSKIKEEAHETIFDISLKAERLKKSLDLCNPNVVYDAWVQKSCQDDLQEYNGFLAHIEQARRKRNSEVMKLFQPLLIAKTVTDVNGFYQLSGLTRSNWSLSLPFLSIQPSRPRPSEYYIFAQYSLFDNHIVWFEPVEVTQNKIIIDLNNDNKSSSFYWEYD